jgi:hypothetical protein
VAYGLKQRYWFSRVNGEWSVRTSVRTQTNLPEGFRDFARSLQATVTSFDVTYSSFFRRCVVRPPLRHRYKQFAICTQQSGDSCCGVKVRTSQWRNCGWRSAPSHMDRGTAQKPVQNWELQMQVGSSVRPESNWRNYHLNPEVKASRQVREPWSRGTFDVGSRYQANVTEITNP